MFLFLPLVAIAPVAVVLAVVLAVIGFIDAQADVGMNAVGVRVEEAVGRSVMTRLHGLWETGHTDRVRGERSSRPRRPRSRSQLLIVSVIGVGSALYAGRLIPDATPRRREASDQPACHRADAGRRSP